MRSTAVPEAEICASAAVRISSAVDGKLRKIWVAGPQRTGRWQRG